MLSSLFESGTSIQWSDLLICILVSLALGLLVARVHKYLQCLYQKLCRNTGSFAGFSTIRDYAGQRESRNRSGSCRSLQSDSLSFRCRRVGDHQYFLVNGNWDCHRDGVCHL